MKDPRPDFYLASAEGYGLEEPRRCFAVGRISGDKRDDYLLVRLDPPIPGQSYGLGGQDIDQVIVATRHQGETLFPIKSWPVFVHVARLLVSPEGRMIIHGNEMEAIAWAELYETEAAARKKAI